MTRATSRRNAAAVLVDADKLPEHPGEFRFQNVEGAGPNAGIIYACPCGCGAIHGAAFSHGNVRWTWDGNVESPTVTPSLGLHPKDDSAPDGSGYHWHGFLTAGVFREC